jgi:ribosomal protein S18 acetylase RimI-like enzyme
MFGNVDLVARLDRAEARLCSGLARTAAARDPGWRCFVHAIAGGAAVFAGPGSPANKVIGAAFGIVPDESEIAAIEADYADRGVPFQAEVSTLAEPAFAQMLLRRGYLLQGYENLLGRRLSPMLDAPSAAAVSVELVSCPDDTARWVDLLATGFLSQDVGGVGGDTVPPHEEIVRWSRLSTETPGYRCYAARIDGELAGGGAMYVDAGVAILCGASTLPAFRRRGVQTMVLRARLADAAQMGCEYAMVTVQPASKSQQNVQREGFSLLASRALLVKQP